MPANTPSPRIGLLGSDEITTTESRGCCLWPPGYAAALTAAGGTPVVMDLPQREQSWEDVLSALDGVLLLSHETKNARQGAAEERLCQVCRQLELPVLAVDRGLHVLNTTFGGTLFQDLSREQPQALQHRHPPERGLRHTIMVEPGTRMAGLYGEGEIVVNSEHRRAVARVARGFRVSANALDGIIEAIEAESERWFAVGVQWQPASASASGLDIQLFRGLVDASLQRQQQLVCGAAPPGRKDPT